MAAASASAFARACYDHGDGDDSNYVDYNDVVDYSDEDKNDANEDHAQIVHLILAGGSQSRLHCRGDGRTKLVNDHLEKSYQSEYKVIRVNIKLSG